MSFHRLKVSGHQWLIIPAPMTMTPSSDSGIFGNGYRCRENEKADRFMNRVLLAVGILQVIRSADDLFSRVLYIP